MASLSPGGQLPAVTRNGATRLPSPARLAARPPMAGRVAPHRTLLDISRLLSTVRRTTPSGIDRVEMAYARHWLTRPARERGFVAQSPFGWYAAVAEEAVAEFAAALGEAWAGGGDRSAALRRARGLAGGLQARLALGAGRQGLAAWLGAGQRTTLLIASHRALEAAPRLRALKAEGMRFVPFIHDLIPLTHPEYTRPRQVAHHAARVTTVTALADGLLVNSAATAAELRPHFARARRALPPLAIAPLGVETAPPPAGPLPAEPYFVCLGTIEPRKNHLLLLQLWRELAEQGVPQLPRLLLIGRRGWENEHILRMLERCQALRGHVEELGPLPDAEARRVLAGARALLFPSFAEGYGLPLAEALGLGVPAIASDLPALREVGGAVPDYLSPNDGAAWRRAVLDYATPGSPTRAAQLARLATWVAPSWPAHFAATEALLEEVAGAPSRPASAPANDFSLASATAGAAPA
ncbi:glycosyltransferase family 4 protein [Siccirubricoccus sp. KC 17139]|uniref:Glycosyltransferase family 4 protein n=1 Tax=Siccirubricoccus soli TaxID=2899147 RepID=A0ABT1DAG6_9PROT|nr:glycosyltransferase family 1 protein [Siccirubricoccus soli]MCO6418562.1 glycosyltransferase family 4 protein [Siccirubricoccus soli]MCP2684697.1 glycosyltransferase family 4 protein [Siccirubricoccus soli]